MLTGNKSPFAAIGFGDLHRDGMTMAVVAVRATYSLSREGSLHLADAQSIALSDIFEGDPQRTPLLRSADLIPYKPGADVTVLGHAHASEGRLAPSWRIGITVGDHTAHLRVHGPRRWEPTLHFLKPTWKLGTARPAASVSLDYRLAAGGYLVGHPEGDVEPRNPIGPGILNADWSPVGRFLRAPQIEAVGAPLTHPFERTAPQGFGPIPPWWLARQTHAGTYDERWRRDRAPRLPEDFDYRFYQTAHPDLIMPHLRGDETVALDHLTPFGDLTFALPGVVPMVEHRWFDGRRAEARLTLDGLHLDLRAEPWRVDLTWRGWIETCPRYAGARLDVVPLAEAAGLPGSGEAGLEAAA